MTYTSSEISLYVDAMIIDAIVEEPSIIKEAGASEVIMSLVGKVRDYIASKIRPDHKAEDLLNLLAPGVISTVFSIFGKTWIGILFGLATSVFKINIGGIVLSLYNTVKSLISGGKQTTSSEVDSAVADAVKSNAQPLSSEDEAKAIQTLEQNKNSTASDVGRRLRDARAVKLAMVTYRDNQENIHKVAGLLSFGGLQGKIIGILITLFGYVFKIALSAAGFMVAGDVINSYVGKAQGLLPSFTGTSTSSPPISPPVTSTQTRFKLNPSYKDIRHNTGDATWAEGFMNTTEGISDMLVQFTKEVYVGLNDLGDFIKSMPTFKSLVNGIETFNSSAAGSSVVFIPRGYTTKKQLVDLFIDDVAEKAPKSTA